MDNDELLEKLAELEHEQWGHWFTHMNAVLHEVIGLGFYEARDNNLNTEGLERAREALGRWTIQARTPYSELSEQEKDSDREWARKALMIVRACPRPPPGQKVRIVGTCSGRFSTKTPNESNSPKTLQDLAHENAKLMDYRCADCGRAADYERRETCGNCGGRYFRWDDPAKYKRFETVGDVLNIVGRGLLHTVISPEGEALPQPGEVIVLDEKAVMVRGVEAHCLFRESLRNSKQTIGLMVQALPTGDEDA